MAEKELIQFFPLILYSWAKFAGKVTKYKFKAPDICAGSLQGSAEHTIIIVAL